jgi:hypothetical protein
MQRGMNLFSPLIANAFFAAQWRMPAFTEGEMHVQCVALSAEKHTRVGEMIVPQAPAISEQTSCG